MEQNKETTKKVLVDLLLTFMIFSLCLFLIGCSGINEKVYQVNGCEVERVKDGQLLTCGLDTVYIPDQMDVLSIVDPCGDGPGVDEVVIVVDGNLYLAWYKNVGLTVLIPDVKYQTTDKQRCQFRISDGEVDEL